MKGVVLSPLERWVTVCFLATLFLTAFASSQETASPKGLVIHKNLAGSDDLANATEFLKIERFSQVTNVTPLSGGPVRIYNDRVAEIVEYTDLTSETISTDGQIAELKAKPADLGILAKKYPKAFDLLAAEARRINTAVQMLDQGKVLVAGKWRDREEMTAPSTANDESLTVTMKDGQTRSYTGVKVTGQDPDALRIMHSGGATSIPFEQLTEADREKFGFDAAKAEEFRKQKEMASSSRGRSFESILTGVWIQSHPTNTGIAGTFQRKLELSAGGTAKVYRRTDYPANDGVLKEWALAYEREWHPVESTYADTGQPFRGFVITGTEGNASYGELSSVYVLSGEGKILETSNSNAAKEAFLGGSLTEAISSGKLRRVRELDLDRSEEYRKQKEMASAEKQQPMIASSSLAGMELPDWSYENAIELFLDEDPIAIPYILKNYATIYTHTGKGISLEGTPIAAVKGNYKWLRITLPDNPAKTLSIQEGYPSDPEWGEPKQYEVKVICPKTADTGERHLVIKVMNTLYLFLRPDGNMVYFMPAHPAMFGVPAQPDRYVPMVREDANPFSR